MNGQPCRPLSHVVRPDAGAAGRSDGTDHRKLRTSPRGTVAALSRRGNRVGGGTPSGTSRGMRVRLESKQGMADRMLEGSLPALSDVVQRTVDRLSSDKERVATALNEADDPNGPVTYMDESFTPIMDREDLEMDQSFCRVTRRYDPAEVAKYALANKFALAVRASSIASALGAFYVRRELIWKNLEDTAPDSPAGVGSVRAEAAYLRKMLAGLGPTFVKLGQNLGNRPDLVRADYMDELCALQDRVPPFDNSVAMAAIREACGDLGIDEVFERLSPEPVAAASLGQVYKGTLRANGAVVAVKVQRPGVEPQVLLDLYLLRYVAERSLNDYALKNLGVQATLLVDEFGEKLLEELDYVQEARSLLDFRRNFSQDPNVLIPEVYQEYCSPNVLVMEWVDGIRCTDPTAFESDEAKRRFITIGVESGMKQLLEFGLFHGDPHPGNVLALRNGDIGYVDFGNVAEISRMNQECLIDSVVHAMNDDYVGLAGDLQNLGFLAPGTDVVPIAEALRSTWAESLSEAGLANFSFRTLTDQFNKLLYRYPIRVPERFSLIIRALLTQEGICLTLDPDFQFLEIAFPYVARRLLTDPDPALRLRLLQVVIIDGQFQWPRLMSLIELAKPSANDPGLLAKLDLAPAVRDGVVMLANDHELRSKLLAGFTSQPLHVHLSGLAGLLAVLMRVVATSFRNTLLRALRRVGEAFAWLPWNRPRASAWPRKRSQWPEPALQ